MITANGKLQLRRVLARQATELANYISIGTGTQAATVNDVRLAFEVSRIPVMSISADPTSDRIVFRGNLPAKSINTVYEVGLWSSSATDNGRDFNVLGGSSPISWINGTLTNVNARAHANSLKIDYVTSGTTNAELTGIYEDLSIYRDSDSFAVAYHATTNLSAVKVRLGSDSTNYYEFTLPAPVTNSYNIARLARSAATKTGSPNWAAITYIAVRPTGTSGGAGSIYLDGIRMESNALDGSSVLVARTVLATPTVMSVDIDIDLEYSVKVDIA